MRTTIFAPSEYYHLYNRGAEKKNIFCDKQDYVRFMFLMFYFQSPTPINNTAWYTRSFLKTGLFRLQAQKLNEILKSRYIELTAFTLMPNHFHLLVQNLEDSAVSVYMQRVLTAYSKYFNAKYKATGHLFQGPFGAVHVKKNEQLLHLSAYIHKNPKDLHDHKDGYDKYQWSSYQDYLSFNRWDKLLKTDMLQKQFASQSAYKNFVETSTAKEIGFENKAFLNI